MGKYLNQRWSSIRIAIQGWYFVIRTQPNARIYAGFTIFAILMGLFLKITFLEWAIILLAIMVVWTSEMINTAIEAAVNLISLEIHPQAKIAKDVSAGAVLFAAMISVLIGLCIFGPRLLAYLQGQL